MGNFPLNDDYQYARPVAYLIDKGHYYAPDSFSPIIIAQVYWGALFCLFSGFSFDTLRISVLVLGLVGIIGFYFLLDLITNNKKVSFIGAIILLINPLYLCNACSFMTDVPFLALVIISVLFFVRFVQTDKVKFLVIATVFAILATLIRQFCIAIVFAYAVALIIKNRPGIPGSVKYFIPAILAIVSYNAGLWWLKHIGSELRPYAGYTVGGFLSSPATIAAQTFERAGHILYYTSFFLFPLLICNTRYVYRALSPKNKKIVIIFPLVFLLSLLSTWHQLPYGPVITQWTIGVNTLKTSGLVTPHIAFDIPQIIINSAGFIGAILLLINVGAIICKLVISYKLRVLSTMQVTQVGIIAAILGYAMLVCVPQFFFDRYTLLFIPLFLLLVLTNWQIEAMLKPGKLIFFSTFVLIIAYFSTAATHDYMEWNRTRWQAIGYLTNDLKIPKHKIDGGSEFRGWINEPFYPSDENDNSPISDEYVVTFTNLQGYEVVKQYSYQNYFPFQERSMYILHRK